MTDSYLTYNTKMSGILLRIIILIKRISTVRIGGFILDRFQNGSFTSGQWEFLAHYTTYYEQDPLLRISCNWHELQYLFFSSLHVCVKDA